ncbi:cobalamin-independent methionine synthase II family protein [Rothia sp. AR01]|uniref:Cobalamin-independent methionine synthase II family protein n=1 Tax=Rothia santali TaxID=2949643 RepID=A0A9X2KHM7_9MICC|nr:cobalamin-independent methionine synthase II family protein [Rothia santali]MCP3424944.1 cobalamin-independent methionine synthase II family protein [Rothia santali]
MLNSSDRIRTTHVGSLPRPTALREANAARRDGSLSEEDFRSVLTRSVDEVVARQVEIGLDTVNDGEYGHAMAGTVDYGAWWHYSFARTGGLDVVDGVTFDEILKTPGNGRYNSFAVRRDWTRFADFYAELELGNDPSREFPIATGPLTYEGGDAVAADIRNLTGAVERSGASEAFVAALSPGSASRIGNRHYATDEEFIYAWADVLHEEYKAITDAGLIVQLDDPSIAEAWDQLNPEPTIEEYLRFNRLAIEAANYALRGIPEEQVRFHLCWGSWHGPHTTDIEIKHLIESLFTIDAGAYSFEAANVRHAHEWKDWEGVKLPEGKLILPGVVSHSTNVVEHPELVAQRIEQYASVVGRENVIASTDCGLGGRIHPEIAEAKLRSLTEGARIASGRLF